jgi:hypothetical protein
VYVCLEHQFICDHQSNSTYFTGEYLVMGLRNGIQYSVTIAAKNKFGVGKDSIDPIYVTTDANPGEAEKRPGGTGFVNKNKR